MNGNIALKLGVIAGGLAMIFAFLGCAPVTISSVPPDAQVYCKGGDKLIGTTPVEVRMAVADKEVVVRKAGYFPKTVTLSTVDSENVEVRLMRRGKVLLLSKPKNVNLFVDGFGLVGSTPYMLDYDKPYRTFEVKTPGYAMQSFTIPESPTGNVIIDLDRYEMIAVISDPEGAKVFNAAGENIGETPLAIPFIDDQVYELRESGYYNLEFSVDKKTGSSLSLEMKKEPIVIISSDPEGAIVVDRGVVLGRTPYRHLVTEELEFELKLDRYYSQRITVVSNSLRNVTVVLDPKPYVLVQSLPEGGDLYRSGGVELIGHTPVEVLVEKDLALEIHKKDFDIKPFILSPESSREVSVPLVKSQASFEKTVLIDSEPSGALVYRPGGAEFIGETPLEQHLRSERSFELQLNGFVTKIITVAPDSSDSIVFVLEKEERVENRVTTDPLLNIPASF